MLSYHICQIYRAWKSIHIGWGEILKLSYWEGRQAKKKMGPFLWGNVTPEDTM